MQVEYSRDGRIVKGAAKAVVRSKYQVSPKALSVYSSRCTLCRLCIRLHPTAYEDSHIFVCLNMQEDVAVNNHTSVWGSFYDRRSGKWGYKCCHSTTRNSYCLGDEGKQQNDRSNSQLGTCGGKEDLTGHAIHQRSHTISRRLQTNHIQTWSTSDPFTMTLYDGRVVVPLTYNVHTYCVALLMT